MNVEIWPDKTSQPIVLEAKNTYKKGGMYCVYAVDGRVHKYPLVSLFRVIEDYGYHGGSQKEEERC